MKSLPSSSAAKEPNKAANDDSAKNTSDSEGGKKHAVASKAGGKKKAAASKADGKKKPVASLDGPKRVERKRKDIITKEDEQELPEELTDETLYKKMRTEAKHIRDSVPKNPFRCPDLNAKNLTKKEETDYYNWLVYKKGHIGLTRDEEGYLASLSVNEATGTKTYLD